MKVISIGIFSLKGKVCNLVSDGSTESNDAAANANQLIKRLTKKLPAKDKVFRFDNEGLHYFLKRDGYYFYVFATTAMPTQEKITQLFDGMERISSRQHFHLLNSMLVEQNQRRVKIEELQDVLQDTKQIMAQNIEKIIARGEAIEDLVKKTESLHAESVRFRKTVHKKFNEDQGCWASLFSCCCSSAADDDKPLLSPTTPRIN